VTLDEGDFESQLRSGEVAFIYPAWEEKVAA